MKVKNYREIPGEPVVEERGLTVRYLVSDLEEEPKFAIRLYELEPGHTTTSHVHFWEHQAFVLAGQGVLAAETGECPLGEGDVVYVPPLERHQFINTGDRVLRFLMAFPIPRASLEGRINAAGSAGAALESG